MGFPFRHGGVIDRRGLDELGLARRAAPELSRLSDGSKRGRLGSRAVDVVDASGEVSGICFDAAHEPGPAFLSCLASVAWRLGPGMDVSEPGLTDQMEFARWTGREPSDGELLRGSRRDASYNAGLLYSERDTFAVSCDLSGLCGWKFSMGGVG